MAKIINITPVANAIIIAAMLLTSINMNAQSLSVEPIEAQTGEQTDLLVSLMGGGGMTALQFNLTLPEGMAVNTNSATLGTATDGHTLCIETLDNGDHLLVLYSMDLKTFGDGELLRLPVTVGDKAGSFSGSITVFRTATAEAVSHPRTGATFPITVTDEATAIDASLNDNGKMTNDNYYSIDGVKLNGEPTKMGIYIYKGKKVLK